MQRGILSSNIVRSTFCMNAISSRYRTINRGYNKVVISILKFDTHFVVGTPPVTLLRTTVWPPLLKNLIHLQSLAMRIRSFTMSITSLTLKCKLYLPVVAPGLFRVIKKFKLKIFLMKGNLNISSYQLKKKVLQLKT